MRIIAKKRLIEFWTSHPDSKASLSSWHDTLASLSPANLAKLREVYPHADQVGRATVFNIKGNHYRLITSIRYTSQITYILEVMTHAEYSKDEWKQRHHVYD
jgi:mRNA interferase HigB